MAGRDGHGPDPGARPPALSPGADAHEVNLARRVAGQYLSTFSVNHGRGGVVLDTGGGGAWYPEYAYRARDRVFNGFLQSVLSLSRFARQADRLSRRHPVWALLADRARERVRAGALAASTWLPAYDLGGGATLYQLGGSVAGPRYRAYHQALLGDLAQIPYLPAAWRDRFEFYRVRSGRCARGWTPGRPQLSSRGATNATICPRACAASGRRVGIRLPAWPKRRPSSARTAASRCTSRVTYQPGSRRRSVA